MARFSWCNLARSLRRKNSKWIQESLVEELEGIRERERERERERKGKEVEEVERKMARGGGAQRGKRRAETPPQTPHDQRAPSSDGDGDEDAEFEVDSSTLDYGAPPPQTSASASAQAPKRVKMVGGAGTTAAAAAAAASSANATTPAVVKKRIGRPSKHAVEEKHMNMVPSVIAGKKSQDGRGARETAAAAAAATSSKNAAAAAPSAPSGRKKRKPRKVTVPVVVEEQSRSVSVSAGTDSQDRVGDEEEEDEYDVVGREIQQQLLKMQSIKSAASKSSMAKFREKVGKKEEAVIGELRALREKRNQLNQSFHQFFSSIISDHPNTTHDPNSALGSCDFSDQINALKDSSLEIILNLNKLKGLTNGIWKEDMAFGEDWSEIVVELEKDLKEDGEKAARDLNEHLLGHIGGWKKTMKSVVEGFEELLEKVPEVGVEFQAEIEGEGQ